MALKIQNDFKSYTNFAKLFCCNISFKKVWIASVIVIYCRSLYTVSTSEKKNRLITIMRPHLDGYFSIIWRQQSLVYNSP